MLFPLLAIIATVVASTYKSLDFYFWHDDYAVFYGAKLGLCILGWPYNTFCSLFNSLYQVLGYNPRSYFVLGIILLIFASVSLFLLLKELFKKNIALYLSLVFATGYIGSGIFLEAYDPFISYPSIGFLFLSLLYLVRLFKKFEIKNMFLSSIFFIISIVWFYARSGTYLFPIIAFIYFYSDWNMKKKLTFIIYFGLLFAFFFFIFPLGFSNSTTSGNSLIGLFLQADWMQKLKLFIETLGGLVLPYSTDASSRLTFGLGINVLLLLLYLLGKSHKNKEIFKLRIISIVWILFLYLPYGLRSDWRLEPTHRYLMYITPGLLIYWGTLSKIRFWRYINALFIIVLIVITNSYLNTHLQQSKDQGEFLRFIRLSQPNIKEGSLVYVDFSQQGRVKGSDFFRVGTLPPESVIGAEYGIPFEKVRLITDPATLSREINDFDQNQVYSFYFNGDNTEDSTARLRDSLNFVAQVKINKHIKTQFLEDKNKLWTAKSENINISDFDFNPTVPSRLSISYIASRYDFPTPFSQNCINCSSWRDEDIIDVFSYLKVKNDLAKNISVSTSQSGEDTSPNSLIDDDNQTIWMGNRQEWYKKNFPMIIIQFSSPQKLKGMNIYSNNELRSPTKLLVALNNQTTEMGIEQKGEVAQLRWEEKLVQNMTVTLLETKGGDNPVLTKVEPLSTTVAIAPALIGSIEKSPAAMIRNIEVKNNFFTFLESGAPICLKWNASGYGSGVLNNKILVDGRVHELIFDLPSFGIVKPELFLECLDYPVNFFVSAIEVKSVFSNLQ